MDFKKVVKEKESNSAQWEIGPAASYLDQKKFGSNLWTSLGQKTI